MNTIESKHVDKRLIIGDDELIMMIHLGSLDAMNTLLDRYLPIITNIARKYERRDRGITRSELIQDSMDAFLQSIDTYRNELGIYYSYVNVIIENSMKQYLKKWFGGNKDIIIVPLDAPISSENSMQYIDCIEDKHYSSSPDRIYILNEKIDEIENAFMILTPEERFAMTARINNVSYEEIARQLGVTVKKVDNILASARRKIRKYLKLVD